MKTQGMTTTAPHPNTVRTCDMKTQSMTTTAPHPKIRNLIQRDNFRFKFFGISIECAHWLTYRILSNQMSAQEATVGAAHCDNSVSRQAIRCENILSGLLYVLDILVTDTSQKWKHVIISKTNWSTIIYCKTNQYKD